MVAEGSNAAMRYLEGIKCRVLGTINFIVVIFQYASKTSEAFMCEWSFVQLLEQLDVFFLGQQAAEQTIRQAIVL